MRHQLEISKTIHQDWTDESVAKVKAYWSGRGFEFTHDHNLTLSAKRGFILWNFITYNMARLATVLTICPGPSNQITVTMKVCTMWQSITE